MKNIRDHDLQELLAAAQARVRAARVLLGRPRTCHPEECITLFREAQGYLEWVRDSLPRAGPAGAALRPQAASLGAEIRQTGVLLEHAALCGRRWIAALRSMAPEYTPSGAAIPVQIRGHISFLG